MFRLAQLFVPKTQQPPIFRSYSSVSTIKPSVQPCNFSNRLTIRNNFFNLKKPNQTQHVYIPNFLIITRKSFSTGEMKEEKSTNGKSHVNSNESVQNWILNERKQRKELQRHNNSQIGKLLLALLILVLGLSYSAVPLYRLFCSATGYGGTVKVDRSYVKELGEKIIHHDRPLTINFLADTNSALPWNFVPVQKNLLCVPGEPVLAFYNATNTSQKDITGVATYNVLPQKAGNYFVKVQCFCFEEQRLGAKESVDMPVLFYIDPKFCQDPEMIDV